VPFALLPIATMTMTECLNNIFVYDMTYLGFVGNYVVILLLYFLVFALSGSIKISMIVLTPVFYGFALAHAYLANFRGTPFIPMDFLSVTTAINVGSTYDYTPTDIMITGTLLFIFLMVLAFKVATPKFKLITKIIARVFTGSLFLILAGVFYFTSFFADMGIKPDFWNQTRGYRNYGFVYNFVCNTKYLYMSTPQGYDPNDIQGFVDKETDKNENKVPITENAPNIICIMNESLADLSVLGEFTTNEDYMPFMHSLTENTVKGNLYVPVLGAGTSNTEFEFITGHTTAFLPAGSSARTEATICRVLPPTAG
jgi:phosphoglycerol transferase MdoB-like AlkP superfamily enzyme